MNTTSSWQLDDDQARLAIGRLTARLDLNAPERGLHQIAIDEQPFDGHLLAVQFLPTAGAPLVDFYVRGDDLVATYGQTEELAYRPQVYWRAAQPQQPRTHAALDVHVSVQTSLLDSQPVVRVTSRLPVTDAWRLDGSGQFVPALAEGSATKRLTPDDGPGCVLYRLEDGGAGRPLSYAEMVYPSDFVELTVQRSGDGNTVQAAHRLFAAFLEKGVIRRARLRGVLLDRDEDLGTTAEWYGRMASERLPLTT